MFLLLLERMVMNKNTYSGLALAACISFASVSLQAEAAPTYEPSANMPAQEDNKEIINKPETYVEPSELQREQGEHNKSMAK